MSEKKYGVNGEKQADNAVVVVRKKRIMPKGKPFTKGGPGNPKGRHKDYPQFKAECRKHTAAALKALVDALQATKKECIVHDETGQDVFVEVPDHRMRTTAADSLLDRGWGRAAQVISGEDGNPLQGGIIFLPSREEEPPIPELPAPSESDDDE